MVDAELMKNDQNLDHKNFLDSNSDASFEDLFRNDLFGDELTSERNLDIDTETNTQIHPQNNKSFEPQKDEPSKTDPKNSFQNTSITSKSSTQYFDNHLNKSTKENHSKLEMAKHSENQLDSQSDNSDIDNDQSSGTDSADEVIQNELKFLSELNNEEKGNSYNSDSTDEFEDVELDFDGLIDEELKKADDSDQNDEDKPKHVESEFKKPFSSGDPHRVLKENELNTNSSTGHDNGLSNPAIEKKEPPIKISLTKDKGILETTDITDKPTKPKHSTSKNGIIRKKKKNRKLRAAILGDTAFLKKYRNSPASLIVHLFESYFKFEKQEGVFSYNDTTKFFFNSLNEGRIPIELLSIISDVQCKLYEGCLIVEIHDFRKLDSDYDYDIFSSLYTHANSETERNNEKNFNKKDSNNHRWRNVGWNSMRSTNFTLKQLKDIQHAKKNDNDSSKAPKNIEKHNSEKLSNGLAKCVIYRKVMRPTPETMHLDLLLLGRKHYMGITDLIEAESKLLLLTELDLDLEPSPEIFLKENATNFFKSEHLIPRKKRRYNKYEIEAEHAEVQEKKKLLNVVGTQKRQDIQHSFSRLSFVSEFNHNKNLKMNKPLMVDLNLSRDNSPLAESVLQANQQLSTKKLNSKKTKKSQLLSAQISNSKPNLLMRTLQFVKNSEEKPIYFTLFLYSPEKQGGPCKFILRFGSKMDSAIDGDNIEFFVKSEALANVYADSFKFMYSLENIKLTHDSAPLQQLSSVSQPLSPRSAQSARKMTGSKGSDSKTFGSAASPSVKGYGDDEDMETHEPIPIPIISSMQNSLSFSTTESSKKLAKAPSKSRLSNNSGSSESEEEYDEDEVEAQNKIMFEKSIMEKIREASLRVQNMSDSSGQIKTPNSASDSDTAASKNKANPNASNNSESSKTSSKRKSTAGVKRNNKNQKTIKQTKLGIRGSEQRDKDSVNDSSLEVTPIINTDNISTFEAEPMSIQGMNKVDQSGEKSIRSASNSYAIANSDISKSINMLPSSTTQDMALNPNLLSERFNANLENPYNKVNNAEAPLMSSLGLPHNKTLNIRQLSGNITKDQLPHNLQSVPNADHTFDFIKSAVGNNNLAQTQGIANAFANITNGMNNMNTIQGMKPQQSDVSSNNNSGMPKPGDLMHQGHILDQVNAASQIQANAQYKSLLQAQAEKWKQNMGNNVQNQPGLPMGSVPQGDSSGSLLGSLTPSQKQQLTPLQQQQLQQYQSLVNTLNSMGINLPSGSTPQQTPGNLNITAELLAQAQAQAQARARLSQGQAQQNVANTNNQGQATMSQELADLIINIPNVNMLSLEESLQLFARIHNIQLDSISNERGQQLISLARAGTLNDLILRKQQQLIQQALIIQGQKAISQGGQLQATAIDQLKTPTNQYQAHIQSQLQSQKTLQAPNTPGNISGRLHNTDNIPKTPAQTMNVLNTPSGHPGNIKTPSDMSKVESGKNTTGGNFLGNRSDSNDLQFNSTIIQGTPTIKTVTLPGSVDVNSQKNTANDIFRTKSHNTHLQNVNVGVDTSGTGGLRQGLNLGNGLSPSTSVRSAVSVGPGNNDKAGINANNPQNMTGHSTPGDQNILNMLQTPNMQNIRMMSPGMAHALANSNKNEEAAKQYNMLHIAHLALTNKLPPQVAAQYTPEQLEKLTQTAAAAAAVANSKPGGAGSGGENVSSIGESSTNSVSIAPVPNKTQAASTPQQANNQGLKPEGSVPGISGQQSNFNQTQTNQFFANFGGAGFTPQPATQPRDASGSNGGVLPQNQNTQNRMVTPTQNNHPGINLAALGINPNQLTRPQIQALLEMRAANAANSQIQTPNTTNQGIQTSLNAQQTPENTANLLKYFSGSPSTSNINQQLMQKFQNQNLQQMDIKNNQGQSGQVQNPNHGNRMINMASDNESFNTLQRILNTRAQLETVGSSACQYSALVDDSVDWGLVLEHYNKETGDSVTLEEFSQLMKSAELMCPVNKSQGKTTKEEGFVCPYAKPKEEYKKVELLGLEAQGHVRLVNLDDVIHPKTECLGVDELQTLLDTINNLYDSTKQYNAVVIYRRGKTEYFANTNVSDLEKSLIDEYFLPPLQNSKNEKLLELNVKIQQRIFELSEKVAVYAIVSGKLWYSSFPIFASVRNLILTENFSLCLDSTSHECDRINYPYSGLNIWKMAKCNLLTQYTKNNKEPVYTMATPHQNSIKGVYLNPEGNQGSKHVGEELATIRFILNHNSFVARSPEFIDLGLSIGMVMARNVAKLVESLVSSARCPKPHTKHAMYSTAYSLFEYPGPSKISAYKKEISEIFQKSRGIKELKEDIIKVNENWAKKYIEGPLSTNLKVSENLDEILTKVKGDDGSMELDIESTLKLECEYTLDYWKSNE
ncbi:hypothetical protein BB559_005060 [Furculomyces boomerangus]|uniref:Spt20-like SEP domain-containing protein n=2 Tax=Harpellales TaxID=61421 RepID=A0A2T9YB55_9FUNG|nr:hypothetical protein BB559_005060 [Furculomyces boomerangus]